MAQTSDPTTTTGAVETADVINRLAGLAPDSPLARLRAQRPDVMRYAQSSYRTLLEPDDPAGVSRYERELIALRVAVLTPDPAVAAWQRERLATLGASEEVLAAVERFPDGAALGARETAILRHTDRLTLEPGAARPVHLAELKAAGLGPRDIVTIAQLIAFLSFEVRVLAGLRLLAEEGGARPGAAPSRAGRMGTTPPTPGQRSTPFTMDVLRWQPWLETIDETGATPEQTALVDKVSPIPAGRPYYALLAHDLPALRERTALFNAVMYGRGGATRSERELASVAASLVNGCGYCTSVHARRYAELTKDTATTQRLLDEGLETALGERERVVVDYAVKLTREPAGMTAADLAPLRRVGLSDAEILDLGHATAMFAWANRLMQTLGEGKPLDEASV